MVSVIDKGSSQVMSGNIKHIEIPWKRFWIPLDTPIHVGDDGRGFLTDPEGEYLHSLNALAHPLASSADYPCLVLCGDPGLGKSTELSSLASTYQKTLGPSDNLIKLDFRDIPNENVFARKTFQSPQWQKWTAGPGQMTLIIDSIDEGLIKIPSFLRYLRAELDLYPIGRLRLVLACRAAEWPRAEGKYLLDLWGARLGQNEEVNPTQDIKLFGTLELCPLRHQDVRLAATSYGLDPDLFLEAIYQKSLAGLACRPVTLLLLLREFKAKAKIPDTYRNLYESATRRLLGEVNPERAEALKISRARGDRPTQTLLYAAAQRIGAGLILCGRSAISTSTHGTTQENDLHISDLEDRPTGLISEKVLLETLYSPLFTSYGPHRHGFCHQTFAESLAAEFLSEMPLSQIRNILCGGDANQEYVIPQLGETAAWLAAKRDDFLTHILAIEPVILLRSDMSKVTDERKEQLVDALLTGAHGEEIFDENEYHRFYHALRHPRLASQLRPVIEDRTANRVARRMAIDIGEACRVQELAPIYLERVNDSSDLQHIREQCASALEEAIPAGKLALLIPFALGKVSPDTEDSIRGCAIRRLVPDLWSLSESLRALKRPQNTHHYGSYYSLLNFHLPKYVRADELPRLLRFLLCWRECFDRLCWFHLLANEIFNQALLHLHHPEIRNLASLVWILKNRRHHPLPDSDGGKVVKSLIDSDQIRRDFLKAIIENPLSTDEDLYYVRGVRLNLVLSRDCRWAFEQLASAKSEKRKWAAIVSLFLYSPEWTQNWDYFLEVLDASPELKAILPWFRAWSLEEELAVKAKARWTEQQKLAQKYKRQKPLKSVRELLTEAFSAGEDPLKQWPTLAHYLELEETKEGYHRRHDPDPTKCPGWKLLSQPEQGELNKIARLFLISLRARQKIPGAYRGAIYQAVWLLRATVPQDMDLQEAIKEKCILHLLSYFSYGSNHYQEIAALAYRLQRPTSLKFIRKTIKKEVSQENRFHCLSSFRQAWDSALTQVLTQTIRDCPTKENYVQSGLAFLAQVDPKAALGLATELLRSPALPQESRSAVIAASLYGMPEHAWGVIWPIIETEDDVAKRALLRVVAELDHHGNHILPRLSEAQMGKLYLRLRRLFPFDDPPQTSDSTVTPDRAIVWFRNDVINALTNRANDTACQELIRLAAELPSESVWLKWRCNQARTAKRRQVWTPPDPRELIHLEHDRNRRFVKDTNDLQNLILESLERLQVLLTGRDLPRAEDLWRWDGADPARANINPKEENFFSSYLAARLREDLSKHGTFVGRELQLRPGQRTDIHVSAIANDITPKELNSLHVVIEIKGCWNPEIKTALKHQLVETYLRPNGLTHGIYLVGWFVCDAWVEKNAIKNAMTAQSFEEAQIEAHGYSREFDGKVNQEVVRTMILDCRYPKSRNPKLRRSEVH
jgi:hypothetical protein